VVGGALFHEPDLAASSHGIVIVRDVDYASTSESSLLPFYGRVHLGYTPSQGVVLGLSKVARLVTMFSRRLQTQERFAQELLTAFEAEVLPQVETKTSCFLFTASSLFVGFPFDSVRSLQIQGQANAYLLSAQRNWSVKCWCWQGCAVVVEAQQLEYGRQAEKNFTQARSGCFLQDDAMQVIGIVQSHPIFWTSTWSPLQLHSEMQQ
jgi:hypothetical protein